VLALMLTATAGCPGSIAPRPACRTDADCNDGRYCNGEETCGAGGVCQIGEPPCPPEDCDESDDSCPEDDADSGGDGGADPCPGNSPPVVQPIEAEFLADLQSTTYTVSATDPEIEPLTYEWSVPSCGTISFPDSPDRSTMVWNHPHPPCDPTTEHADEVITLTIADECWSVTCRYQGADTGRGNACEVEPSAGG